MTKKSNFIKSWLEKMLDSPTSKDGQEAISKKQLDSPNSKDGQEAINNSK